MAGGKRSHQQAGLAQSTDDPSSSQPSFGAAPATGQGAPQQAQQSVVDLTMDDGSNPQPSEASGTNQEAEPQSSRESSTGASGSAASGEPSTKKRRKRSRDRFDPLEDCSAFIRRRYRHLQRTGQSCDFCMAKRLTCDNKLVYRGYWEQLETSAMDLFGRAQQQQTYIRDLNSYANIQAQYITQLQNTLARYTDEQVLGVNIPDNIRQSLNEMAAVWPLPPLPSLPPRFEQPSREEEEEQDRLTALNEAAGAAASNAQTSTQHTVQGALPTLVPAPAPASAPAQAPTNPAGSAAEQARRSVRQRGAQRGSRGSRAIGATTRVTRSTTRASRNALDASALGQHQPAGNVPAQQPQNGQFGRFATNVSLPAQGSVIGTRSRTGQFRNTQTSVPQQPASHTNVAQDVNQFLDPSALPVAAANPDIFSNDPFDGLAFVNQFNNDLSDFQSNLMDFDIGSASLQNQGQHPQEPFSDAYTAAFPHLTLSAVAPLTTNVVPPAPLLEPIDPTLMQGNAPDGMCPDDLLGLQITPTNGSMIPTGQDLTGTGQPEAQDFDPLFDELPDIPVEPEDLFNYVVYDNEEQL